MTGRPQILLVIAVVAAHAAQPRESSLDHPSAIDRYEVLRAVIRLHASEGGTYFFRSFCGEESRVGAIRPETIRGQTMSGNDCRRFSISGSEEEASATDNRFSSDKRWH